MSHTIILNTYEYAKALKRANVPDAQIEVEVARDMERTKAINEVIDNNLATKQDIKMLEKDIKILETKIESINSKTNIILWVIGATGFIASFPQILKALGA